MFENIGRKIKGLAKVIFWFIAIGSLVASFIFLCIDLDMFLMIGLPMLAGPLVAWVSTLTLYGFGELIEKATEIAANTRGTALNRGGAIKSEVQIKAENERISKLEALRAQGLISEEEYKQTVSKQQ